MGRLQRQVRLTLFIFDLDLFTLLASDVGGRAGAGGIYAGRGVANRAAESGIHRECGTTGRHRFIFLIRYQQRFNAQHVYVHGISVTGGGNLVLRQNPRLSPITPTAPPTLRSLKRFSKPNQIASPNRKL